MAKLIYLGDVGHNSPEEGVFFRDTRLVLRAVPNSNMAEWLEYVGEKGRRRLLARAINANAYFEAGAPGKLAQVLELLDRGDPDVWEFRGTHKGARAPHLRMLGLFVGSVITGGVFWAAIGLKKQNNQLRRTDIDSARKVMSEWRSQRRR